MFAHIRQQTKNICDRNATLINHCIQIKNGPHNKQQEQNEITYLCANNKNKTKATDA